MTPLSRVAFIGNSLPRRCGIATFTTDLQQAVAAAQPQLKTMIVAMNDEGHAYDYPSVVRIQIHDQKLTDYVHAADVLNAAQVDVVCLQHEYGIYGGAAGDHVMALLSRLSMPIVTTLHTVLSEPTPVQRAVTEKIIDVSARIIVMAEKAKTLLQTVYG
ncbi:MAG: glycosyl transferase family 1, partial [Rhizobiales bacterium 32-66-8]